MIHLRTRTELIQFARDNCTSSACKRAFLTGTVTVFGGFDPLPPGTVPGWILCVRSIHGRAWYLAVLADDVRHCFRVREQEPNVPWEHWKGSLDDQEFTMKSGDIPVQADAYRRQACQAT